MDTDAIEKLSARAVWRQATDRLEGWVCVAHAAVDTTHPSSVTQCRITLYHFKALMGNQLRFVHPSGTNTGNMI